MKTDALTFVTGDENTLKEILRYGRQAGRPQGPMEIFAEATMEFLESWSGKIRSLPRSETDSTAAAFALWSRRASLVSMKKDYEIQNGRSGRGICLQFVPSNMPGLFAYSLAAGLLSGNSVVMRLPSREDAVNSALISTLKAALEGSQLFSSRIVLIRYDHDREITDQLSEKCGARVIWGGDRSVEEIQRSPLKPGAAEIAFPNRHSMAVLDAKTILAGTGWLIRDFYNDTYLNDQNACSSPSIIFWKGSEENVKAAREKFWQKMEEFLTGRYPARANLAVKKWEQAEYMAACAVASEIERGSLEEGNSIVRVKAESIIPELWDHVIPGGFFIECSGEDVSCIKPLLVPVCQTISVAGPDELEDEVRQIAGQFQVVRTGHTLDFSLRWDRHDLIMEMSHVAPEEFTVEADGCSIHAIKQGSGPVLMLIHGVACDSSFFAEAAELLARDYTVITFDRRGYSKSRVTKEIDGDIVALQAADAVCVLDALAGKDAKAIVAGCSAGGLVALEMARAYPERVSKLYLYEAAYSPEPEDMDKMDELRDKLHAAAQKNRVARAMLYFIEAIGEADPLAKEVSTEQLQQNIDNLQWFLHHEVDGILGYSRRRPDIKLKMPCECGAGTLDPSAAFGHMMVSAAKHWNVTCSMNEGCHNLALDRPETFAGWIKYK
ncbi:MAG: alpha/beta fold hydrolase [Lachnospiraceae bacterium]|nr:alpha/beta fold hydrolase [Lachnospiraceae bacterium]